jgi:hypothetical protein
MGGYVQQPLGAFQAKEDSPVADAAAQLVLAFEVFDITVERIELHFVDGGTHAGVVARRKPLKRLSSGTGEDDEPRLLLFGVHRVLRSRRV